MNRESVGFNIRLARTKQNLTQEKLAEMADISPSYISAIERGKQSVSLDYINRIAQALHVPVSDLLVHEKTGGYGIDAEEGRSAYAGSYVIRQRRMNEINAILSKCSDREFQIVYDEIQLLISKFDYMKDKGMK